MAKNTFQLNYDEMTAIAKKFKDEGEDIARLHATTRQKVRDLFKDWVGEGADKFFDEMETKLLPAVQRLSQALFHSQDATNEIMKIIQSADEETVGFFRNQLSGDDFGASRFGAALQGLQGGSPGADDFGAGKFGEALGSPLGGGSTSPDDFGAGKFGEALDGDSSNTSQDSGGSDENKSSGGGNSSEKNQKDKETPVAETESGSGGGGGGGSSSQGLKGDLKNLGVGLGGMTPQNASSGGSASVNMPDHVYSSGSDPSKPDDLPKPSGNESKPSVDTGSGDNSQSSSAGIASAAGGVAAAAGAAKVIKKKKRGG